MATRNGATRRAARLRAFFHAFLEFSSPVVAVSVIFAAYHIEGAWLAWATVVAFAGVSLLAWRYAARYYDARALPPSLHKEKEP